MHEFDQHVIFCFLDACTGTDKFRHLTKAAWYWYQDVDLLYNFWFVEQIHNVLK